MDTIIIKIYGPNKFKITTFSWFVPELVRRGYNELSQTEKRSTRPYLRRFVFHPPRQDAYLPRIEVFEALTRDRKDIRYILKAEFSLPKLLYGNSLQEAVGVSKEAVLARLQSSIADVGIFVEKEVLEDARVSAAHFCKNIPLPSDIRMQEVLKELMLVDISKVVDVTKTEFKQGGHTLHIYSGTVERVFYDKIADAIRPKGKRKDKGHINEERGIVEEYKLKNREVFRYEYRIKKTQTVTREINIALGRDRATPVTLKDLFVAGLCKQMVLVSWHALIQRPENKLALLGPVDELGVLLHILTEAKKQNGKAHSMNNALISYGLARVIGDHGAKEVRRAIFGIWNADHSERLTNKIKMASDLTRGLPYSNAIVFIDKALEDFQIINLISLEYGL